MTGFDEQKDCRQKNYFVAFQQAISHDSHTIPIFEVAHGD